MIKKIKRKVSNLVLSFQTRNLDWGNYKTIFAVSTGRTGTNFLEKLINEVSPSTLSVHEPWPDLFDLSVNQFRNNMSEEEVCFALQLYRMKQLLRMKKEKKNIYFESNPNLNNLTHCFQNIFADFKMIVITRNYQDYIASSFNKSPDGTNRFFTYDDNDHRKRLTPFDLEDEKYISNWNFMHQAEKIAWYYSVTNKNLLDQWYNKANVMWIKFEDLFGSLDKSIQTCKEIFQFLDIDSQLDDKALEKILLKKVNENKNLRLKNFDSLPENIKNNINKIVEPSVNLMKLKNVYGK